MQIGAGGLEAADEAALVSCRDQRGTGKRLWHQEGCQGKGAEAWEDGVKVSDKHQALLVQRGKPDSLN